MGLPQAQTELRTAAAFLQDGALDIKITICVVLIAIL